MATVRIRTSGTTLDGAEIQGASTEETLVEILLELRRLTKTGVENGKKSDDTAKVVKTLRQAIPQNFPEILAGKIKDVLGPGAGRIAEGAAPPKIISGAGVTLHDGFIVTDHRSHDRNGDAQPHAPREDEAGMAVVADAAEKTVAPMESLTAELIEGGGALKLYNYAMQTFGIALHAVSGIIETLMKGETGISALSMALSRSTASIPIFGELFGMISTGLQTIEQWNDTLFRTNMVGASFGGSLMKMAESASYSGLKLEDFANIIIKNGEALASLGGMAHGTELFTQTLGYALRNYSVQLSAAGISMQQFAEEAPALLTMMAAGSISQRLTAEQAAKSTVTLITQFDALSKLTGKSREQIEKEQGDMVKNAAMEMKMSGMTQEAKLKLNTAMAEVTQVMGKTAGAALRATLLGMVPMTEEMQILAATVPEAATEFAKLKSAVNDSSVSQEQFTHILDDSTVNIVAGGMRAGKSLETAVDAALSGLGGTPATIAKVMDEIYANKEAYLDANGQLNRAALRQALENARKEQTESDAQRKTMAQFRQGASEAYNALFHSFIEPLVTAMLPYMKSLTDWMVNDPPDFAGLTQVIVDVIGRITGIVEFFITHWRVFITGLVVVGTFLLAGAAFLAASLWLLAEPTSVAAAAMLGLTWPITAVVVGIIALVAVLSWLIDKFDPVKPSKSSPQLPTGMSTISPYGHAGGTVASGALVQDFGIGTNTVLHGREAVFTEPQLKNLTTNTTNQTLNTQTTASNTMLSEKLSKVSNQLQEMIDLLNQNVRVGKQIHAAVM